MYGRDRELLALTNRLLSERLLLMYSPSGAGKTSLLQAQGGLRDRMAGEGFHLLPIVRVSQAADVAAQQGVNRYVLSTLIALEPDRSEADRRDARALAALLRGDGGPLAPDFLERHLAAVAPVPADPSSEAPAQTLLVLDQFEELLTLDPSDEAAKREFMQQLGVALKDPDRWAVFAMREDYLAALEPYLPAIPTRLSATFRLDFLGRDAARDAIVEPASEFGVTFEENAVDSLIGDLAQIQVTDPLDGKLHWKDGPYVEPLHLQVVCESLWRARDARDRRITARDLERLTKEMGHGLHGVTAALAHYYDTSVRVAANQFEGITERSIRNWFERALISPAGQRLTVVLGSEGSFGLNPAILEDLTDRYLVRRDQRHSSVYYELAHDRLIDPIRESNTRWRDRLPLLPRQAEHWADRRLDSDLLHGPELELAERWAAARTEPLIELDRDFLARSQAARAQAASASRLRQRLWAIVGLSIGLFVTLLLIAFAVSQAWRARRLTALLSMQQGLAFCEQGEASYGMLYLTRSLGEIPPLSDDLHRIVPIQISGWWRQLHRLKNRIDVGEPIWAVAYSPDGKWFFTAGNDGKARLWDAATGDALGETFAHPASARAAAFSPDGKAILTGCDDGKARLWEAATGRSLSEFPHPGPVRAVAFSPDGKLILTGCDDDRARLWDAAARKVVGEFAHRNDVRAVAFSPDGKVILTGSEDNTARIWEPVRQANVRVVNHGQAVKAVAFSPDGQRFLTGGDDGKVRLWKTDTGEVVGAPFEHREGVLSASFRHGGNVVLTGTYDGAARLWDVARGRIIGHPLRHGGPVWAVAFSPDGETILTGGEDGAARLWSPAIQPASRAILRHDGPVWAATFSPDGQRFITGSDDTTGRLWDTGTWEPVGATLPHQGAVRTVAFGSGGRIALTGSYDATAHLWDASSGAPIGAALKHGGPVWVANFGPGGEAFLTGSEDGNARLWRGAAGGTIGEPSLLPHGAPVWAVAFSPDGKTLTIGGYDGKAQLWDAASEHPLHVLQHRDAIWAAAFSPDGKTIATASEDRRALLWDAASGRIKGKPMEHKAPVFAVAFRPGGHAVLTASADRTARLWDADSGLPIGKPLRHGGPIRAIAFSPGGETFMTGSDDATAQVWDTDSGQPLGPPLMHEKRLRVVAFSPDGRWTATASEDHTAAIWELPPPVRGNPRRIAAWMRVATGLDLDDWGGIRILDQHDWQESREELQTLGGPPL
jgi:WD40 repeat protein